MSFDDPEDLFNNEAMNNNNARYEDALLTYPTGNFKKTHGRPISSSNNDTSMSPSAYVQMMYRGEQIQNWQKLANRGGGGGDDKWAGQNAPLTMTRFEWRKGLFIAVVGGLVAVTVYTVITNKQSIFATTQQ